MSEDFPYRLLRIRVVDTVRVSTSFIRIRFAGAGLDDFATPGHIFDQRIKLIFPGPLGLPDLSNAGADWYATWLELPEESRGSMRTYSIRAMEGEGDQTRLVIDFVLHMDEGATGPAASWAHRAKAGDEILTLGPRRGNLGGGIEFAPDEAGQVLLVGDETALPAIARILEDLPRSARGHVFIEVPHQDDTLPMEVPAAVTVHWSVREGADHGTVIAPAVLSHLGQQADGTLVDVDSDELPWETPTYSASGEDVSVGTTLHHGLYAWIAGESSLVTTLRRHLVKGFGFERSQVAFMGYWRKGVAMRG
ncbi:NADPH-dependent ferric siderophore reductase, contains FAD-binding and SIP domains [Micrococcales bacterium KH10]|nr:NADPH-dependent ferric siderophore reductase, contains FAD-binding and SIP domains [Micrococcales bacterium KH10]